MIITGVILAHFPCTFAPWLCPHHFFFFIITKKKKKKKKKGTLFYETLCPGACPVRKQMAVDWPALWQYCAQKARAKFGACSCAFTYLAGYSLDGTRWTVLLAYNSNSVSLVWVRRLVCAQQVTIWSIQLRMFVLAFLITAPPPPPSPPDLRCCLDHTQVSCYCFLALFSSQWTEGGWECGSHSTRWPLYPRPFSTNAESALPLLCFQSWSSRPKLSHAGHVYSKILVVYPCLSFLH